MIKYKTFLKFQVSGCDLALTALLLSASSEGEKGNSLLLKGIENNSFDLDNTSTPVKDSLDAIKNFFKTLSDENRSLGVYSISLSLKLFYDGDIYQEVFALEFLPDGRVKGNKEDISFLNGILLDEITGTKSSPVMTENNAANIPAYSQLFLPTKG